MFNLKPNKMAQKKTIVNKNVQEYEKLHVSMYYKMLQKNDYESCLELSKMFEIFLTHASNEFSRGLDKGKEIWK